MCAPGLLAPKLLASSCLYLPSHCRSHGIDYKLMLPFLALCGFWGLKHRFSYLYSKHIIHWAIFSTLNLLRRFDAPQPRCIWSVEKAINNCKDILTAPSEEGRPWGRLTPLASPLHHYHHQQYLRHHQHYHHHQNVLTTWRLVEGFTGNFHLLPSPQSSLLPFKYLEAVTYMPHSAPFKRLVSLLLGDLARKEGIWVMGLSWQGVYAPLQSNPALAPLGQCGQEQHSTRPSANCFKMHKWAWFRCCQRILHFSRELFCTLLLRLSNKSPTVLQLRDI